MRSRQILILMFHMIFIKVILDTSRYFIQLDIENKSGIERNIYGPQSGYKTEGFNDPYARNKIRKRILNQTCGNVNSTYLEDLTDIRAHVSPNRTVLYCRVNKCASTMTLELLRRIFNCDTECLIQNAKLVKQEQMLAKKIMAKAFSFLVVREPYTRLFSTYSNIFYFPKEDWLYRGTKIIKQVRNNASLESLQFGHDLTFSELIEYTVTNYEKGLRIDEHVRPMSHASCNPCQFNFDFIVKLETLESDFEYLLNEWKTKGVIDTYDADMLTDLRQWTIYGPIKHLFRTIPLIKHSNISLYNIFLRAWSYYQVTGQISKYIKFPFLPKEIKDITLNSFLDSLKKATETSKKYGNNLKSQRIEAMKEAYESVSRENMERLVKVVKTDCLLFGYEEKPAFLFNITTSRVFNKDFKYFNGLDS